MFFTSIKHFRIGYLLFYLPFSLTLISRTASEAYFTLLVIPLILTAGACLAAWPRHFSRAVLTVLAICTPLFLAREGYLLTLKAYGLSLGEKILLTRSSLPHFDSSGFSLRIVGPGGIFPVYSDPYTYLLWWQSRVTPDSSSRRQIIIDEIGKKVSVLK